VAALTEAQVRDALRAVKDPDLGRDIVALGFVKQVKLCGGAVKVVIELTTPACPMKEQMRRQAADALRALPGVEQAAVEMTARTVGRQTEAADVLKDVKNIVAIGSGKGGVGKSTVSVHLALALARTGAAVGLLDADIYGPSIPGMLGLTAHPFTDEQGRAIPPEAHGVKAMSVGMLVGGDTPAIWRGPIASRLLQQFLGAVNWGALDYLLLDLPPGTGDVQLTVVQSAPLNGAVIVTTPQDVALKIARKGLRMFQQVNVPVLGILENMSGFVCPSCGARHDIFRRGGGERVARELCVPFLGAIPLDPRLVEAGDAGRPLLLSDPDAPTARAFRDAAAALAAQLSIVNLRDRDAHPHPKENHLADQDPPRIVWHDGVAQVYDAVALRRACPCAECRDETTGAARLKPDDIPPNLSIENVRPVGRYGLNIVFSDGHASGIYTFDLLRQLGKPV
jgi:ATP-binding protein involved in chromosome partitioning